MSNFQHNPQLRDTARLHAPGPAGKSTRLKNLMGVVHEGPAAELKAKPEVLQRWLGV